MLRNSLTAVLGITLSALWVGNAGAIGRPRLPPGATCEMVRSNVAAYGYRAALTYATARYSSGEVSAAKSCLRRVGRNDR